jgi:hypothetical protein
MSASDVRYDGFAIALHWVVALKGALSITHLALTSVLAAATLLHIAEGWRIQRLRRVVGGSIAGRNSQWTGGKLGLCGVAAGPREARGQVFPERQGVRSARRWAPAGRRLLQWRYSPSGCRRTALS